MLTLKETADWLLARDNFLILTHRSPDGDTIGSAAGLCVALREQGKSAYLLSNHEVSDTFLPYLDTLQSESFSPDFIVSVDTATEELFPDNAENYKGKVDLAIDHHPQKEPYAKENCIIPEKAATGELIFGIISLWGSVSQKAAMPIYIALATDTGCFVYGNTTAETHYVAGALLETGIDVRKINKILFETVTLKQLQLESKLLSTIRLYDNGKIAIVCVTKSILDEVAAEDKDTEKISDFVGRIEGVITGITVREKKNNLCKISVRSNPDVLKANDICVQLGGGGHAAASGARYQGTVEETVEALVKAIETVQGSKITADTKGK